MTEETGNRPAASNPSRPGRGLGRGLAALIGEDNEQAPKARHSGVRTLPVAWLYPSAVQPRRRVSGDALDALAQSVREQGIVQPILVRPHPSLEGRYEIIAGERRWRAAQKAQHHDVPVVIREMGDEAAFEAAVVENVQRADLDAIEEAQAYRKMMDEFNRSQEKVAQIVGKSRAHVANMVRLLTLPEAVQAMLADGVLTAGHGRALVGAPDAASLARHIVARGLSVRAVERLIAKRRKEKAGAEKDADTGGAEATEGSDADIRQLERALSLALGLSVTLAYDKRTGGGTVHIAWRTPEQFDALHARLTRTPSA